MTQRPGKAAAESSREELNLMDPIAEGAAVVIGVLGSLPAHQLHWALAELGAAARDSVEDETPYQSARRAAELWAHRHRGLPCGTASPQL